VKPLYIGACVLLVVAISLRIVALAAASHSSRSLAMAAADRQPGSDKPTSYARMSDSLTLGSAILACLGIASWVCSFARGYRWQPVIPVILIIVYVALFMLRV